MSIPNCPKCNSEYTYEDGVMFICPECGNEFSAKSESEEKVFKDANGTILNDGDSVIVIKDLKVKGSSSMLKRGTKVKNIRLLNEGSDGNHDIDCKIDGFGGMFLKTEFVKKA